MTNFFDSLPDVPGDPATVRRFAHLLGVAAETVDDHANRLGSSVASLVGVAWRSPAADRFASLCGLVTNDLRSAGESYREAAGVLAGALSVPVITQPHLLAFSPESYWKGETHRTCDRPAAVGRLFHELASAGVEQVIVISAAAERPAPHRLNRPSGTLRARMTEHVAAVDASVVRDAIAAHAAHFHGVFLIQPEHNPVGPFDFAGAYDERSDRFQSVEELVDRGYEDAYRQFIEPIVGAVE